jgi:ribonuclease R
VGEARAAVLAIAEKHGLERTFGPEVEREVAAWIADPGIDDPSLTDLMGLPFVTIDNEDSRDLDQALLVTEAGSEAPGAFDVDYALADASHFVRPGMALFAEAVKRASSYYLPGLCVPMLPEAISEGICSLNEGVPRRALVFRMRIDPAGEVVRTHLVRARIRSRAKLSYDGVQAFHDGADRSLIGSEFERSLRLLRTVGELRLRRAEERDVVRYRRTPVEVRYGDSEGRTFTMLGEGRNDVERWNEQISLMCNVEGARFFRAAEEGGAPAQQPIYRVHPAPPRERLRRLARQIEAIAEAQELDPELWRWRRAEGESLAGFLARLPSEGSGRRVARAIHRQALVINVRSEFTDAPGGHHGVGTSVGYTRFSSPMREMVGIFTHKEALEILGGAVDSSESTARDEELRARIIEAANAAKLLQARITKEANGLAIDALFEPDLRLAEADRPRRLGTVMGLARGKVYVQLDEPPIDVKVYLEDLGRLLGKRLKVTAGGAGLEAEDGQVAIAVGSALSVRVAGRDERRRRWLLRPVLEEEPS